MTYKQSPQEKFWAVLEKEIQIRNKKKDKDFHLKGKWKKYIGIYEGYKICAVDPLWVRNNLCTYYGHGGHGMVHEFIPNDEVWVSTYHYYEPKIGGCGRGCKHKHGLKITGLEFKQIMVHEYTECINMKKGIIFKKAHNLANIQENLIKELILPEDNRYNI